MARARDSIGQALIVVISTLLVLSVVPAVIVTQIANNVPVTIRVENGKAALAAAESGVAAYLVQLQSDPAYTSYNDQTCSTPPNDRAFFLPSKCPIPRGAAPKVPNGDNKSSFGERVSGSSPALNERFAYSVNVSTDGTPELYVVGMAGEGAYEQYRVERVKLRNPALSYMYFDNYDTSSPYTYANSAAFKDLMSAVNLILGLGSSSTLSLDGHSFNLGEIKNDINQLLGAGPVAAMNLGSFFCNYHAYDPNPISTAIHALAQAEPTALANELNASGLTGFSILGWNVGQELAGAIEQAVDGVVEYIVSNIPLDGPFPLVCATASSYGEVSGTNHNLRYGGSNGATGGYYGLTTEMSGRVYLRDSLYACGNATWPNAQVTSGDESKFQQANINPLDAISGNQFAYIANDLPQVQITWPIVNTTTVFLHGCQGTSISPGTDVMTNKALPVPTPDFSSMVQRAQVGDRTGGGCLYQGPTVILLEGAEAQVWSPDTQSPSSGCYANGTPFKLPQDGVIYVQNFDSPNTNPNPGTTPPWQDTCNPFPGTFVLLNQTEPIQHHSCYWGDAIIEGTLGASPTSRQNLTIGASNDIVIAGNVTYACSPDGGKKVPVDCAQSLGLAPGGDVPITEPETDSAGTFYPQGNVIINHPVVGGQNDNNCTPVVSRQFGTTVNGTSITCGGPARGPASPPPLPSNYAKNCGPGTIIPGIDLGGSVNACGYDIARGCTASSTRATIATSGRLC